MNHALVLYANSTYSSPYVLSAYAALVEKGLPFELKTIQLGGQQFASDYAGLSMTSRVPTLVAGDFSLSESSAIVEFLEDRHPAPDFAAVLPTDLFQRARARQIMAWLRSDLDALREERPTTVIFADKSPKPLSDRGRQAVDKLLRAADALIDAQGGNLFGQWSVADVDFSVMLNRLAANGDPVPEKVKRYVDRQSQRPCVRDWWARAAENA